MIYKLLKTKNSFNDLIGPFNSLINIGNLEIQIGRGSFSSVKKILVFKHHHTTPNLVLKIGDFCNVNDSVKIILGGEHKNSQGELINTFQDCNFLVTQINQKSAIEPTTKGLISIGNSVVLSANSIILSGTEVGNNSIVGALSLVTGNYEPNSVIAGNPAKSISKINPPSEPWWNYSFDSIIGYFNGEFKPEPNHLSDIYICFDATVDSFGLIKNLNMAGLKIKENLVSMPNVPKNIINYFAQINQPSDYIEINDQIFNELL